MDSRLFHFIKKEFIQLRRDPRMLFIALAAPIIQLIALGYIASTDIKNVETAVFDEDKSHYSRQYLEEFKNSGYFNLKYYASSKKDVDFMIDSGRAKLAVHIPVNFGRKIARGESADVLAVLDGTNSSSATIILNYISQINFERAQVISKERLSRHGIDLKNLSLFDLQTRVWYNPELKSVNFMVPAIFAQLLLIISMILTTSSIIKERERGTMEMLVVTPLKPYELILGKLLPFSLVAFIDLILVFLVATLWFKVPMRGNVLLLTVLGAIFLMVGLGLGVFISTTARTQRQAAMVNFLVMAPAFILSGFIFPIANMPRIIQLVTYLIPLRYFLVIVRDIFLKGSGMRYLYKEVWPLILFGSIILTLSILRFHKKIE
jgi:ABC-2 type transport system permease protein